MKFVKYSVSQLVESGYSHAGETSGRKEGSLRILGGVCILIRYD